MAPACRGAKRSLDYNFDRSRHKKCPDEVLSSSKASIPWMPSNDTSPFDRKADDGWMINRRDFPGNGPVLFVLVAYE